VKVVRMMAFGILAASLTVAVISDASVLFDRVVAVVNKEVITWSELYRGMEFEAGSFLKSESEAERRKIFKENEGPFLESMIDTRLQLQAATKLDINASKEEVGEAIENIKKKYSMNDQELDESLKKERFTMEEYKRRLAEQIILSKVVSQEVKNKIVISEAELNEYVSRNRDPGYSVRQIFIKKAEGTPEQEQRNVEEKADMLFKRLMAGEDFARLAQQYSDDPSGRVGGDLGFVKKDLLGKEFVEVLSQMKVGEISRPFWTDRGMHILKLEDKVDTSNPAELREIAKKKLTDRRFNEEYRSWIRSLREKSYVEVRL
jgi:peptidyl-prolyl cis-trans isomerase SurA